LSFELSLLLLSAVVVSLTASFSNSIVHRASVITECQLSLVAESVASFLSMKARELFDLSNFKFEVAYKQFNLVLVILTQEGSVLNAVMNIEYL
jgi:hypothetical protein